MPNEATNFAEARAENTKDVVLGSGHFSRTITYIRKGVDDREVTAIVRPTQNQQEERRNTIQKERITVVLEAHATRGVDRPLSGDGIKIAGVGGTEDRHYAFVEILSGREGSWKLAFERPRPAVLGR